MTSAIHKGLFKECLASAPFAFQPHIEITRELVLRGIDRVPETASLIDDVRREERRRRSLFVESV